MFGSCISCRWGSRRNADHRMLIPSNWEVGSNLTPIWMNRFCSHWCSNQPSLKVDQDWFWWSRFDCQQSKAASSYLNCQDSQYFKVYYHISITFIKRSASQDLKYIWCCCEINKGILSWCIFIGPRFFVFRSRWAINSIILWPIAAPRYVKYRS